MVDARAIQQVEKEEESSWHGIDLCVGEKDCWRKMMTAGGLD